MVQFIMVYFAILPFFLFINLSNQDLFVIEMRVFKNILIENIIKQRISNDKRKKRPMQGINWKNNGKKEKIYFICYKR